MNDWKRQLPALIIGAIPLCTAAAIILAVALTARSGGPVHPISLLPLHARSPAQLAATFKAYQYNWPPAAEVPPLALTRLPDGLNELDPDRKKSLFLRALLPLALAANNRIRRERAYLLRTLNDAHGDAWPNRLKQLARAYDVDDPLDQAAARADLLRRCDVVPPALVLAQAAKESGWGTSRFALQGNNLFGVHTWDQALALKARAPGKRVVKVRAYPDLRASVRDYIHNLNVGHAYVAFRKLRERQNRQGRMDPLALARTLGGYSTLGEIYTRRLQNLIKNNGLDDLESLHLAEIDLRP